jgi:hypothetical protein
MAVLRDGVEIYRENLSNRDGGYQVNNEYNQDFTVNLPSGKHSIEIRNRGVDWFYLDWVRVDPVLPAAYAGGWEPSPIAMGLHGEREALLDVVSPAVSFPANATNQIVEPWPRAQVTLKGLPAGRYQAWWYAAALAQLVGDSAGRSDGSLLTLALPDLREDLAGWLWPVAEFSFRLPMRHGNGDFEATLQGENGRVCQVEASEQLSAWRPLLLATNRADGVRFVDSSGKGLSQRFYRARLAPP